MGIFIAIIVVISWASHLGYILLYQPVDPSSVWFWLHLIIQTWLFTGLFITGHDAMHGTISRNKRVNNFFGYLSSTLYAGLWYPQLKKKHHLHHRHVATDQDPDYYTGHQNFFLWWFSFMRQYITFWQILIMAVLFNIGLLYFSNLQLLMLRIAPSILSTFQLFYFGTYRPHRLPHTDEMIPHKARSQKRNHLWALLSCFFFGYHFEHHASPHTPWWKLYRIKSPA
jgi:beta-carotene ketolase (CrtW type)